MRIKKGNYIIFQIGIKDQDGEYITDLNTAIEIRYMIKENKLDSNIEALVNKTMTSGDILINTPEIGFIQITLKSGDTESIQAGMKYHSSQIEYSTDDIKEIWLNSDNGTDKIELYQDVIRKE